MTSLSEDLDVDGKTILKWILHNYGVADWQSIIQYESVPRIETPNAYRLLETLPIMGIDQTNVNNHIQ